MFLFCFVGSTRYCSLKCKLSVGHLYKLTIINWPKRQTYFIMKTFMSMCLDFLRFSYRFVLFMSQVYCRTKRTAQITRNWLNLSNMFQPSVVISFIYKHSKSNFKCCDDFCGFLVFCLCFFFDFFKNLPWLSVEEILLLTTPWRL